jgi:hypothetical protein
VLIVWSPVVYTQKTSLHGKTLKKHKKLIK